MPYNVLSLKPTHYSATDDSRKVVQWLTGIWFAYMIVRLCKIML